MTNKNTAKNRQRYRQRKYLYKTFGVKTAEALVTLLMKGKAIAWVSEKEAETMTTIQINHKLKQGHKMFTDKEVKFLLAEIARLQEELKQANAAALQAPMFAEPQP